MVEVIINCVFSSEVYALLWDLPMLTAPKLDHIACIKPNSNSLMVIAYNLATQCLHNTYFREFPMGVPCGDTGVSIQYNST